MRELFQTKTRNRVLSLVVLAAMLTVTYLTVKGEGQAYIWQALGLCLAAYVLYRLAQPRGPFGVVYQLVLIAATPFLSVLLLQNFTLDPLGEKGIYPMMLAVNCLFAYLFYLLVSFALGSFMLGYTISSAAMLTLGIANYFVVQFRGSPIVPWDLYSIRTAASVAGNYTYELSWRFLFSLFFFLLLIGAGAKMRWRLHSYVLRVALVLVLAAGLAFSGLSLQKKSVKDYLGMDQTLFTPNVRYRNNGFLAAFIGNLHLINVEKPEGYSEEKVKEIQQELASQSTSTAASFDLSQAPNIIVIMDEAFSDLSVLGQFGVDSDYMPNFRKLQEEYAGGYLMTSVKGGNTANTEYEFLSGDTMAFLPAGSVVYQQFIHDNVPALPSYLASLGYTTQAIHPYLPTGWNRDTVYPQIGFQSFLSQYDFVNPEKLRDFISDRSAFEKIIEEFEDKQEGEKKFIFEVTMQNHSGYSKEYPGFTEKVHLTDLTYENIQTRAAEKYLTLIQESDQALGELMDYFAQVKEPTMIVMFGDHEPTDYITDVIARITGYDVEASLEEQQKSYLVPYFVWNNFGMEMEERDLTSVNYLAADLLEAAHIPTTLYQQFLLKMQESLPVVCANAYVDAEGTYHSYDEEDAANDELLNTYNILTYNHLTDTGGRVSELFSEPAGSGTED